MPAAHTALRPTPRLQGVLRGPGHSLGSAVKVTDWQARMRGATLTGALLALAGLLHVALSLKIAAFNIRTFGETKISNATLCSYILQILSRYDITVIQEVRDKHLMAVGKLLDGLNQDAPDAFHYVVSEPLGRGSYKERYLYVFRYSPGRLPQAPAVLPTGLGVYRVRSPHWALAVVTVTCAAHASMERGPQQQWGPRDPGERAPQSARQAQAGTPPPREACQPQGSVRPNATAAWRRSCGAGGGTEPSGPPRDPSCSDTLTWHLRKAV
ncbi:PREDICTED: deoxyribonuclease-1 [Condylura cristata]|uniref:deoxyribonuclease-1 n=1 Tax=Condylura cristata TaxID=143302 RepID=UPI000642CB4F|nr:PREDICTED: deoxyribonuclease-1 [Condylura cristata]